MKFNQNNILKNNVNLLQIATTMENFSFQLLKTTLKKLHKQFIKDHLKFNALVNSLLNIVRILRLIFNLFLKSFRLLKIGR